MFQSVSFQKPHFVWAFLFWTLFSSPCWAGFFEEQVQPVKERAFDSTSQRILITGLGATLAASTQDSAMKDQYGNHRTMSQETARLGDEFGTYLVGPAIALGQIYFDPENGSSHARGLIYSTAVTHLLKETIRRERPDSHNHQSMPSGHSSSAFATATSLTYAYGWKAAVVAYPVATFVAFSRIADDVHWFSDTVAGAFVGVWMARASYYSTNNIYKKNQFYGFENPVVVPILTFQKVGVSLDLNF